MGCLFSIPAAQAEEDWKGDWLFKAEPEGAERLAFPAPAWKDVKRKVVIVDGEVCLREGQLEMFACPRGTKEHESIVAVDAAPSLIHKALESLGAKPGSPVVFAPEYKAASGVTVKVMVVFVDKAGKRQSIPAQDWIKNAKTGAKMDVDWVFGGGLIRKNDAGQVDYSSDQGDFICLANFPTAMLDVPVPSSQTNDVLLFECRTDSVPDLKTKVRLVLIPQFEKPKAP